jgi:N-methylhydantoinase B/oxoprolinase/acetone carboxylase alpha subunit
MTFHELNDDDNFIYLNLGGGFDEKEERASERTNENCEHMKINRKEV